MIQRQIMASVSVFLWLGLFNQPAFSDTDDSARIETEQKDIDADKSPTNDAQKAGQLAKQFQVPESTVQDLRAKGQGWGEVTIGLASAQQLFKTDPKTYPTYTDALNKVEALRASGEGWGKIANDLGFKLGPVISDAHHVRHEMHHASVEHPHHEVNQMEHSHPDHPERPERPNH